MILGWVSAAGARRGAHRLPAFCIIKKQTQEKRLIKLVPGLRQCRNTDNNAFDSPSTRHWTQIQSGPKYIMVTQHIYSVSLSEWAHMLPYVCVCVCTAAPLAPPTGSCQHTEAKLLTFLLLTAGGVLPTHKCRRVQRIREWGGWWRDLGRGDILLMSQPGCGDKVGPFNLCWCRSVCLTSHGS